jgi:hypothetical protein
LATIKIQEMKNIYRLLSYIALILIIIACSNARVVIDHGSTRHDVYFIDYEITKLENNDIDVFTLLRKLDKTIATYRDTIDTEEYRIKLAELYQEALDKLNEDLKGK